MKVGSFALALTVALTAVGCDSQSRYHRGRTAECLDNRGFDVRYGPRTADLSVFGRNAGGSLTRLGVFRFYESERDARDAAQQSPRQLKDTFRNVFAYGWFRAEAKATVCLLTESGDAGSRAGPAVTAASQVASSPPVPVQAVDASPDPRDIDLDSLVPDRGRIDYVWYVPAGRAAPAVVVGWSYRGTPVVSAPSDWRYALTLWRRHDARPGGARWTPQTLFRGSPFPFDRASVRTADVTGDSRRDLLVTIECNHCNHGVAAVSIFAHVRGRVRRIYGEGFLDGSKGAHVGVHGRVITETWWGAKEGLVWFDEAGAGRSVCCPDYRLQTFLRWDGTRLQTVATRRVGPEGDHSVAPAMPRP